MDRKLVSAATADERVELCTFLEQLAPSDWARPSLCPGWSVHDVLAHLSQELTLRAMVIGGIRARGNFDRMNADMARSLAAVHEPSELIGQLRRTASSMRLAPFSKPEDALLDVLVHGQDIARPLGRVRPMRPDRVLPALEHSVGSIWYGGPKRFKTVRLVATDIEWIGGTGTDEIRGTAGDLLLVATGRSTGLDSLSGTGVGTIRAQLTPTAPR